MIKKVLIQRQLIFIFIISALFTASCGNDNRSYPRPRGYFRIDFPQKSYQQSNNNAPFICEIPKYSACSNLKSDNNQWQMNLQFPLYNATLHCALILDSNLHEHVDFAKTMAYKHQATARSIEEIPFINESENVYGLLYEIKGEKVACNYSFYLIDSTERFFRGALYFNQAPNSDSLQPVVEFLRDDLNHIIRSFRWTTVSE